MVVFEASGNKIAPSLKEMMKKWSALENDIAFVNAQWEAAVRKPPRPEMRDKTEGIPASEGLFGAKWLMPMEQVLQIAPQPVPFFQDKVDNFYHFGKYHGRQASFIYYFENNLLTEIWVCLNKISEKISPYADAPINGFWLNVCARSIRGLQATIERRF